MAFEKFSSNSDLDNQMEVASWFERSEISTQYSEVYPKSVIRHWGKQVIYNLMSSHCKSISFSSYDDYVKTYPLDGCKSFEHGMEVQFINGVEVFNDGLNAYASFKAKCENNETVTLQDRAKVDVAKIRCLEKVQSLKPYMKLQREQKFIDE